MEEKKAVEENKVNIQQNINKLITALRYKGKAIKYETKLYYNDTKEKYYTLLTFYEQQTDDKGDKKWRSLFTGYNKVEFMKFLADYYKEVIDNETI